MSVLPVQTISFAQPAASGATGVELDLQPVSGQSNATLRLETPPSD
jgi:hypothetical protein